MAGIPTSGPRLAAYRANPGLRAKLPTSLLTPVQQRQRALNARLNAPVMPGSTLTNRALSREVQAAEQEKYGPAVGQGRANVAQAQQFQNRLGGWYDQYRAALAQAQQQIRDAGAQGQQDIQGLLGAANQGFNQDQSQVKESPQLAQQAQQGQAIRDLLTSSFGAMMANQGNAANTRAALQTNVVAPTAKFNAQQASQAGITKAQQGLTDLLGQMGAYGTQYRGQRLTGEQKNALAAQALGVSEQKVNLAAQALGQKDTNARAGRKLGYAKIRAGENKVNQYGYTTRDWAKMTPGQRQQAMINFDRQKSQATGAQRGAKGSGKAPRTGLGSLTQSQENGFYKQIDQARVIVREYEGKLTPQQIRAGMAQGYLTDANGKKLTLPRLDPAAISAAFDLEGTGHALSQATVKALHNRGIHVGGRYTVAKPPTPGPAPASPPLIAGNTGIPGSGSPLPLSPLPPAS